MLHCGHRKLYSGMDVFTTERRDLGSFILKRRGRVVKLTGVAQFL